MAFKNDDLAHVKPWKAIDWRFQLDLFEIFAKSLPGGLDPSRGKNCQNHLPPRRRQYFHYQPLKGNLYLQDQT